MGIPLAILQMETTLYQTDIHTIDKYTAHQYKALKLKCMRSMRIVISPNPETAIRDINKDKMEDILRNKDDKTDVEYEARQKVEIDGKKRTRVVRL